MKHKIDERCHDDCWKKGTSYCPIYVLTMDARLERYGGQGCKAYEQPKDGSIYLTQLAKKLAWTSPEDIERLIQISEMIVEFTIKFGESDIKADADDTERGIRGENEQDNNIGVA